MPFLAFPLHWTGKEGVIIAFRWLTLRGHVFCWMLSVCLCWHKLLAGWLASGRLPAVTFTMRVRWPYCEDATPLCIPPHIPKPTESHPQVKNRGLKCSGCPSSLSSKHLYVYQLPSSHPICFIFLTQILQLFSLWVCIKNKPPGCENSVYNVWNHSLRPYDYFVSQSFMWDLISTFPMSELKKKHVMHLMISCLRSFCLST